jgi:trk system potassium uptake protein TrkH
MFSLTMLPPIVFSLYYDDHSWLPFVEGFGLTLAAGILIWLPVQRSRKDLRLRDGFLSSRHSGRCWGPLAQLLCTLPMV